MYSEGIPEPVSVMRSYLLESGFAKTVEQAGGMGGFQEVYSKAVSSGEVQVQVSADRGHWALAVMIPAVQRWIVPGAWEAYLDSSDMRDMSADQANYIEQRLGEVLAAQMEDANIETRVVAIGTAFMRKLLETPGDVNLIL